MSTDAQSVSHPDYHNGAKDDSTNTAVGACSTPVGIEYTLVSDTSPVASPVMANSTMTGFGGDVTVTLTVLEGRITDCRICGDYETPDTGGRAIKVMQTRLIEAGPS